MSKIAERRCWFCGSLLVVVPAMGEKDAGLGMCESCAGQLEAQIPGVILIRTQRRTSAEEAEDEVRREQGEEE